MAKTKSKPTPKRSRMTKRQTALAKSISRYAPKSAGGGGGG